MCLEADVKEEKSSEASASPFDRDASILLRRYICMRSTSLRRVHVSATAHVRDALEDVRNEQAPRPVCDILSYACSRYTDGAGARLRAVLCMIDETARQMGVAIAAGQPLSVSMRCCRIRQAVKTWLDLEGRTDWVRSGWSAALPRGSHACMYDERIRKSYCAWLLFVRVQYHVDAVQCGSTLDGPGKARRARQDQHFEVSSQYA